MILIETVNEFKLLGVTITDNLDLKKFVSKKVQTCNFKLRNLWHIREGLNFKSRVTMVTNLIISTLDYCNSILAGANGGTIRPLQLMLNRAVRFIFRPGRTEH